MKKYNIKFDGDWASSELGIVSEAIRKMAAYVGGEKNLNTAFTLAAQSHDKNATSITLLRVSTYSMNPNTTNPRGPSAAGWCNCAGATISFGGAVFDPDYHKGSNMPEQPHGPAYHRPSSLRQYELSAQVSVAHELTHVLLDASPSALSFYAYTLQPKVDEEAAANQVAVHAISEGMLTSPFSAFAVSARFWNYP